MIHEENRTRGAHLRRCERLGDLEQGDRTGAVVVGAVADGVEPRCVQAPHTSASAVRDMLPSNAARRAEVLATLGQLTGNHPASLDAAADQGV